MSFIYSFFARVMVGLASPPLEVDATVVLVVGHAGSTNTLVCVYMYTHTAVNTHQHRVLEYTRRRDTGRLSHFSSA